MTELLEERSTALLVALETGVGRSEFHGLRLFEMSFDEGTAPKSRAAGANIRITTAMSSRPNKKNRST